MTRQQLEHIIRAAGTIADVDDIVVIGSQAILGEFPDAPAEFLVSDEADVYPRQYPERGDLIDASIGEGSPFQRSSGYSARGIDETSAVLPDGWRGALRERRHGACGEGEGLSSPRRRGETTVE